MKTNDYGSLLKITFSVQREKIYFLSTAFLSLKVTHKGMNLLPEGSKFFPVRVISNN